jgi:hypothetical protein
MIKGIKGKSHHCVIIIGIEVVGGLLTGTMGLFSFGARFPLKPLLAKRKE